MKQELPKTYDPSQVEAKWYEHWEQSGCFKSAPNPDKEPYCIVIPPPNITGKLHMGHAIDETLQDVIIRYKRMCGYETLWLPGTDHASIATEVKIVEKLAEKGLSKGDVGREGFLKHAWDWKKEYGGTIVKQLRKLGSSCDWDRERFTMDEGCSRAVLKVFKSLYDKGLIYRGDRIVNWCPECMTAISDAEVEYVEQDSSLWHVRYDAPDKSYSITVATTRPETMFGDTAIAVNPNDERYIDIIGKTVIIPVVGREIPIVADEYCEMDFGTGAVKITPAHDPNDFEVGQRANLPSVRVFNDDGKMNENGGQFCGMDRFECRKHLVEALKQSGNLVKIEPYKHNVGTCYRCHTTIEQMVSSKKQWFVSMKPLAQPAIEAVRSGEIKFVPERFSKTYYNWMENIRDWCISRQLWWGHRIPAYYCDECGKMTVSETHIDRCPICGAPVHQDEDVLDTWFSSGMWPFSTLGYPDDTPELKYFYPTSTLVTGYDIIFFWVARMIVFGYEVMGQKPFSTVYIHGLLRDSLGRKMSKSLGNGIDPLEIIQNYGADALRFSLISGTTAGNDSRFFMEKVEAQRNFCNKVYNATRFVLMNVEDRAYEPREELFTLADKWILSRLNQVIEEVSLNLDAFELNMASQKISDFIWSEFCDWYIEMAKPALYGEDAAAKDNAIAVLIHVLKTALQLLHPFMPFITEELYSKLPQIDSSIMLSKWPSVNTQWQFETEGRRMDEMMEVIRAIRNLRADRKVAPSARISATLLVKCPKQYQDTKSYFMRLAGVDNLSILTQATSEKPSDIHLVCNGAEAIIPLSSLVDIAAELKRLDGEIQNAENEIKRAQSKLNNESFVAKAPQAVVAEERRKLDGFGDKLDKLLARRAMLQNEI